MIRKRWRRELHRFYNEEDTMADKLKHLNDQNFKDTIKKGVTLVDFYADWCGPCKRIAPIIQELADEMHEKATIAKLDIEAAQETTGSYSVMSIPTIILFKDGQEIQRIVGLRDKASLKKIIEEALV